MTVPVSDGGWETPCPEREDGQHCDCWYDGEACCACGAPAMSDAQKEAQGMLDDERRTEGGA